MAKGMNLKPSTEKVGRNAPCPCGSGLKYKKCCLGKNGVFPPNTEDTYLRKYGIRLKKKSDIEGIRKAGGLVLDTLSLVESHITPGMITDEINTLVHEFTIKNGATPAPLNYRGFPKSICTSVNNVVCHGIPGDKTLKSGDAVNIDITVIKDGFHGDTSRMFMVGKENILAKRLSTIAREAMWLGIRAVQPGARVGDIGHAIQTFAEAQGYSVVREFTGHGIGREFHTAPSVLHFGAPGTGEFLVPGMTFTVEPMINLGHWKTEILGDGWTAVTVDGALSAQFEHTCLVTDDGVEVLTLADDERPLV